MASRRRRAALVVFLGGLGGSPIEDVVASALAAATADTIEAALAAGYGRALLVTDGSAPLPPLPEGVTLDEDGGDFHFGRRLAAVVERHGIERVVYLGGGSLPLLGPNDFGEIADALDEEGVVVTNNYFSSDLVAFEAGALARVEPPSSDNRLARALVEEAGQVLRALPRTVATQLDIDGPTDLAVLALTGEGRQPAPLASGPRLRDALASTSLDLEPYRRVLPLFTDREAQVVVSGRVGSHAWQYLEQETACRVRLFAEERGMEADGRAAGGTARSLLGFLIDEVGPARAMETLAELGDAALIDSRVLLAHARVEATRAGRFLSDAGRWPEIGDSFLRELTRAAVEAPAPVLLGGHSLVSGGLMALNELAWREREGE